MSGSLVLDDHLLDDPGGLGDADAGGMLLACATAGAQVRTARRSAQEAGVPSLVAEGRPRAVVVAGVGGSGIAGSVLAAVTGPTCPVPVVTVRDLVLPGWVGSLDLVVAVSCSGTTEEALALAEEAARRGARLMTVSAPNSPLYRLGEQARAMTVPVEAGGRTPRANLWGLAVPLVVAADVLGLAAVTGDDLERAADDLDQLAEELAPARPVGENAAKDLALALGGSLPLVMGGSAVTNAAAYRLVCQLAENAKVPAVLGELPEAGHNLVVALDGPYAGSGSADDIFRDPFEETPGTRLRVVMLRDAASEHPGIRARADGLLAVAEGRGVPITVLHAGEGRPLARLAPLMALADFATAYLALGTGVDPTPIRAIDELKARTAPSRERRDER